MNKRVAMKMVRQTAPMDERVPFWPQTEKQWEARRLLLRRGWPEWALSWGHKFKPWRKQSW